MSWVCRRARASVYCVTGVTVSKKAISQIRGGDSRHQLCLGGRLPSGHKEKQTVPWKIQPKQQSFKNSEAAQTPPKNRPVTRASSSLSTTAHCSSDLSSCSSTLSDSDPPTYCAARICSGSSACPVSTASSSYHRGVLAKLH